MKSTLSLHKRIASGMALVLFSSGVLAQFEAYYDSADATSPRALRESLHEIINDHQRFPYTSFETDTWDILEIAQENPDDPNRIITIYRNASFPKQGGGNELYDREHSWPKSYGFPDDHPGNYPYTDMHALFLSDDDYNFARSNNPYAFCGGNCFEYKTDSNSGIGGQGGAYPSDSNWQAGLFTDGKWEVWKERRGDIARAQMYMDLRYAGGSHGTTGVSEPDLILTDDVQLMDRSNTGNNESVAYMGMLSVLLEWHQQDPVSLAEYQHHETVAAFQGNRNPFIDHPEWVTCVYEGQCPGFSINAGLNDAWFNPVTSGQGFFIIVWENIQTVFLSWFTYDIERPAADVQAILGEPGQRWITAQGSFAGDTAMLDVYVTRGGVFDSAEPAAEPAEKAGTMKLQFSNCNAGLISYDIPALDLSGTVLIQRVAPDNVDLCESLKMR